MTLKWKRANKTELDNKRTEIAGAIWLVYRTDVNARGFWLVKRMLGWKKFCVRELSRNQWILRFDVILQHDWPIEQCLLHMRGLWSFHPLAEKTNNEHLPEPFFKVTRKSFYAFRGVFVSRQLCQSKLQWSECCPEQDNCWQWVMFRQPVR